MKHNTGLSPLDSEAKAAFAALRGAVDLVNQRRSKVKKRWRVRHFIVHGARLERWFLKTMINLCTVRESSVRWAAFEHVHGVPIPKELVDIAFGIRAFRKPMGLYTAAYLGQTFRFSERVEFSALFTSGHQLMGGMFSFLGFTFFLYTADEAIPPNVVFSTAHGTTWNTNALRYHTERINWNVQGIESHHLRFLWS